MRNQIESIYVILFLIVSILIILLSFYALTYSYNENVVFGRFTSLSTLSNYLLGYLQTALVQEGYARSYDAGINSWGKEFWASYPPQCASPPPCEAAVEFYNNLLTSGYARLISIGGQLMSAYKYYFPYSISFNFSNYYKAAILGTYKNGTYKDDVSEVCSKVNSGEYDYNFPIYVDGVYIDVVEPSSGSIIPYSSTANITNNPAFYLYKLAYEFSYSVFPKCSLEDCKALLYTGTPSDTCAREFESFSGNPEIKCNETIFTYPCKNVPECKRCSWSLACKVILRCSDHRYNVYYNGNTYPQTIAIASAVLYQNITIRYYLNCEYECSGVYDEKNKNLSIACKLVGSSYSCAQQKKGCGNITNITKIKKDSEMELAKFIPFKDKITFSESNESSKIKFTYSYHYSIEIVCSYCRVEEIETDCPLCLPGRCPPRACPAIVSLSGSSPEDLKKDFPLKDYDNDTIRKDLSPEDCIVS